MDGLECSEISIKDIKNNTYDFRVESEFYKKDILGKLEILRKNKTKTLENDLANKITDGTHYTPNYASTGVPFLSAINVKENNFDLGAGYKYISVDSHEGLIKRVHPKSKDVLLRKVGVGPRWACVVPENVFDFSIFVSVALIRANINPYYLSTFINTSYGQFQLLRFNKGISQPDLHLEDIAKLEVPIFSDAFYGKIESIILNSESLIDSSKKAVVYSKSVLMDKIPVEISEQQSVSIKQMSSSYGITGRLDSEYYQTKYDVLFTELSKYPCKKLGGENGLVGIKKSIEPGSDAYQEEGIPFVRVSDMTELEISKPSIYLPVDYVDNMESLFPKKDTILLSKDGSVGIAHKVNEQMNVVTSGAILHLTIKDTNEVLPDYLTLVLNSQIVKLQAERDSNGAIIQHWKPSEIENVLIPVLDMDVQQEIVAKVQESFDLRKKSKQLLGYAKQAVEIAIEQDENVAVEWLNEKVKDNGDR